MISTQTLYLLGTLLAGWAIRHWFPPASAQTPAAPTPAPVPTPANPFADKHPALTALEQQGAAVINAALQDWLANGLSLPGAQVATGAAHPIVSAASNVAAQAGQAAAAQVMSQIQAALQAAPVQPLAK